MGIEPTSEAWEASILPLNYARSSDVGLRKITTGINRCARRCVAQERAKRTLREPLAHFST